jgi:hypothetical protein
MVEAAGACSCDPTDDGGAMALTYLHAVASLDGYSEHAVVVSHRPKPAGWHPEASYHFASSVEEGIGLAQDLAGDGEIGVTAGDLGGGQALALGLIDRVTIDVVPTVFGHGKRYFGGFSHGPLLLGDPDVVVRGERVLHRGFPVRRRS